MTNPYKEELPDSCPPGEALEANNLIFYRLIRGDEATEEDFFSFRKLHPVRKVNLNECQTRSVSVQMTLEDAYNTRKLSKNLQGKRVGKVAIGENSGVYKKTSGPGHYSWWILKDFKPENNCTVLPEPGAAL